MSPEVSTTKKLVSASALMASGTMISRALGLVRVMMIAFILGNGTRQADILSIATSVPNSLYILFAGGALNTVLVPQIVRAIKHDDDGGEAYTNRIMTAFMLIVAAVAVIVTVGAPVVTSIYTSSGWHSPELASQYASMVALAYLTLPQIFFYGAFFLLGQVLNARDRFGPMMWAPIANNVIAIMVLATYLVVWGTGGDRSVAFTSGQIWLLGIGSTLGIATQSAVLLPYLRKVGFKFRPRFDLKGTGLGKTFSLTKWTVGFVAVNQLALVVVQRLATSATATGTGGGAQVYANAHLVWILPHSLITVSLATAMLPNASRLAAAGNMAGVASEATKTMRLALVALVPAAVGFIALASPIAKLLFGHGKGTDDALWVGYALAAFAVGLVPFTVQFVCLRTYYAIENTRTPFLLQCIIAAVNAGGALLLVWWVNDPTLVAAALALSYSIAYMVGVLFSWHFLKRHVPDLDGTTLVLHIVRLVLGAGLGGVLAYLAAGGIVGALPDSKFGSALAVLAGLAVIGIVYVGVGKLLRVRELGSLTDLVQSRFGRRGNSAAVDAETDAGDLAPAQPAATSGSLAEDMLPTQLQPAVHLDDELAETSVDAFDPESVLETRIRPAVVVSDDDVVGAVGADSDETAEEIAEEPAPTLGEAGELLSTRYRLEEPLALRHGIESWRAHDLQLSRDVLIHVIPDDPRVSQVLDAARTGAAATDSRFLRVLDAVALDDDAVGGYVVCEYAAGTTLSQLLGAVQLSTLEAAWIVRELADALSAMHTEGLFHEQLTPDNVVITPSGAVRLVGFGVESVLAGSERPISWSAREEADVTALAALLYALLSGHWPGRTAWGLPAAPVVAGRLVGPHRLRPDVPAHLDRICTTILAPSDSADAARITTASQLVAALSSVLGSADPSSDLEDRIRSGSLTGLQDRTDQQSPAVRTEPHQPDGDPTDPQHSLGVHHNLFRSGPATRELGVSKGALPDTHEWLQEDATEEATEESRTHEFDAKDPLEEQRKPSRSRRPVLWLIAALAIGVLVVSLIVVATNRAAEDGAGPAATTSAQGDQTPGEELSIVSGIDFDPEADGGNAEENTSQVPQAFDGDPETGWSTVRYHNHPDLGRLKPGVGIVLDLGQTFDISSVDVQFAEPGASVELRVPADADVDSPPMTTQSDWSVVASQADAGNMATLTPTEPTTSRFLLLYLTSLPQESNARFQSTITEVVVNG